MTDVKPKQLFAPIPLRAMKADLSGLRFRVLSCVAAHDRMSRATGKGRGCDASNKRMADAVGCGFARLCATLSELVDKDFLSRERLGRQTIYRVIYSDDDTFYFGTYRRDHWVPKREAIPPK